MSRLCCSSSSEKISFAFSFWKYIKHIFEDDDDIVGRPILQLYVLRYDHELKKKKKREREKERIE